MAPEAEKEVEAQLITLGPGSFTFYDALPLETEFADHISITVSLLQQVCAEEVVEVRTNLLQVLHTFVFRSSMKKMAMRCAYHCRAITKDKKRNPATADNIKGILTDYLALLQPPPTYYKQVIQTMKGRLKNHQVQGDVSTMIEGFASWIGSGSQPLNRVDDADADAQFEGAIRASLQHYSPSQAEIYASRVLDDIYGCHTGFLDLKAGFYLTAEGRSRYHQLFLLTLFNAVVLLKVISSDKFYEEILADLESDDSRGQDLVLLVLMGQQAAFALYQLAYNSRLLGLHLSTIFRDGKRKAESPSEDLSQEADTDLESDAQGLQRLRDADMANSIATLSFHPDAQFPINSSLAQGVVRWARMITLHQHSVESLVNTGARTRLNSFDAKYVHTRVGQVDSDMESLRSCVSCLIKDPEDAALLIDELSARPDSDTFNGTFHCETVLMSLYLLSSSGHSHPGVSAELLSHSRSLLPQLIAVSKGCCPVCSLVLQTITGKFSKRVTALGSDPTYSPVCLPPWLPRNVASTVLAGLQQKAKEALYEKLGELRSRQKISRSSQSPQASYEIDQNLQQQSNILDLDPPRLSPKKRRI